MDSSDENAPADYICVNSWDLSKSDYAKVLFCDLYHHPDSSVGCRFQITDNVHEDPCDFVGLFRVGYDNLSQCLVSKMLSETQCEEDGKLLRCVFKKEELPDLEDGFYQFLYVTRDKEVCGASMPFEIKHSGAKDESSDEDVVADRTEGDFLVVRSNLVEKNRTLEILLDKHRSRILSLSSELAEIKEEKEVKESIIANLHQEIMNLRRQKTADDSAIQKLRGEVETLSKKREDEHIWRSVLAAKNKLVVDVEQLHQIIKEKDHFLHEQRIAFNEENKLLLEQMEDGKVMIKALEDSKCLALKEMSDLSEVLNKKNLLINELKCENLGLKLKLDDELAINANLWAKAMKEREEELEKAIEEKNTLIEKMLKQDKDLKLTLEEKNALIETMVVKERDLVKTLEEKNAIIEKEKVEICEQEQSAKQSNDFMDMYTSMERQVESILNDRSSNGTEQPEMFTGKEELLAVEKMMENMKTSIHSYISRHYENLRTSTDNSAFAKLPDYAQIKILEQDIRRRLQVSTLIRSLDIKAKELQEVSLRVCDSESKSMLFEEEVHDMKSHCADLLTDLREKETAITKLKEECIKKDAVIEYLNNEKVALVKNEASLHVALNDSSVRLQEAAELYKKQYLEIEKLNRKLKRSKHIHMQKVDSKTQTPDNASKCSSNVEAKCTRNYLGKASVSSYSGTVDSPIPRSSSDSDTGEHVLGNSPPVQLQKPSSVTKNGDEKRNICKQSEVKPSCAGARDFVAMLEHCKALAIKNHPYLAIAERSKTLQKPCKSQESPELYKMIEQNLANLSASKSKDQNTNEDDVTYTVPCALCDKAVSISTKHPEAMVMHLEDEHKQQMCPVCGRLYDMRLPSKYFAFHVDDHFNIQTKK